MKRLSIIACAAVLGVFTTASVANAAAPEVSKKSCEAQGGTFSNDQGMKTCTTVRAPETQLSGPSFSIVGQYPSIYYRGDFHYVFTVQVTITESEKGNGDVTTTNDLQMLSRELVKDDCSLTLMGTTTYVDTGVCDENGVYPVI
jgi:hypothetical protein